MTESQIIEKAQHLYSLIEEDERERDSLKDRVKACEKRIDARESEIRKLIKASANGQEELPLEEVSATEPECVEGMPHDWIASVNEPNTMSCARCKVTARRDSAVDPWGYVFPASEAPAEVE